MKRLHRKLLVTAKLLLMALLCLSTVSCAFFGSPPFAETAPRTSTEAFGFRYEEGDTVISFAAAGDNLLHSGVYKGAYTGNGYDMTPIYENIAPFIREFDIAFVNQETPLGESGFSGYPRFCSPYEAGDALVAAGFDVINIANNHMLDRGDAGLLRTKNYLEGIAEAVVGGGEVRIIERKGVKIAFLGYTYATNCDGEYDVPQFSERRIRSDMEKAHAMADLVFVSVHWGVEYDIGDYVERFYPTSAQEELAELFTELHADVLIGTHPHVVEGIEWKNASDGHKTLVVYSLGNLVSNMRFDKTLLGGILALDILANKRYTNIVNVRIIPTVCHYSTSQNDHKVYFLRDYDDSLAKCHGTNRQNNELPFCKDTLIRYYENNIPLPFRTEHYK